MGGAWDDGSLRVHLERMEERIQHDISRPMRQWLAMLEVAKVRTCLEGGVRAALVTGVPLGPACSLELCRGCSRAPLPPNRPCPWAPLPHPPHEIQERFRGLEKLRSQLDVKRRQADRVFRRAEERIRVRGF